MADRIAFDDSVAQVFCECLGDVLSTNAQLGAFEIDFINQSEGEGPSAGKVEVFVVADPRFAQAIRETANQLGGEPRVGRPGRAEDERERD